MYHPTTRVLTILELLQSRGSMSGGELAARLEVDRRTVRRYITMLQDLGIPAMLGHLDLNPWNIIVASSGTVFLDWAEAYVGNPLFSLEYLLEHAGRRFRSAAEVRTKLVAAYCAQWNGVVSSAAIAEAWVFAPLLAVFAYAVGSDAWQHPQRLPEPVAAGYLRSLARRMRREADELADRRSACLA